MKLTIMIASITTLAACSQGPAPHPPDIGNCTGTIPGTTLPCTAPQPPPGGEGAIATTSAALTVDGNGAMICNSSDQCWTYVEGATPQSPTLAPADPSAQTQRLRLKSLCPNGGPICTQYRVYSGDEHCSLAESSSDFSVWVMDCSGSRYTPIDFTSGTMIDMGNTYGYAIGWNSRLNRPQDVPWPYPSNAYWKIAQVPGIMVSLDCIGDINNVGINYTNYLAGSAYGAATFNLSVFQGYDYCWQFSNSQGPCTYLPPDTSRVTNQYTQIGGVWQTVQMWGTQSQPSSSCFFPGAYPGQGVCGGSPNSAYVYQSVGFNQQNDNYFVGEFLGSDCTASNPSDVNADLIYGMPGSEGSQGAYFVPAATN